MSKSIGDRFYEEDRGIHNPSDGEPYKPVPLAKLKKLERDRDNLLEALRDMIDIFQVDETGGEQQQIYERAVAAVGKALTS